MERDARSIRRENVRHHRELLEQITQVKYRNRIKELFAEEEQKQLDAGDFKFNAKAGVVRI